MEDDSLLARLAVIGGMSEAAVKLFISIVIGYPLAFLYRSAFYHKSPNIQHAYFAICGIAMCYFNYGIDVIHSLLCVTVLYLLLAFIGGTRLSVWIGFVYFMGYLLCGYYFTETEEYDILWTMPHCILTLKIIGLVMDVYDGHKSKNEVSRDQKEVALTKVPSFLEIFGYSFLFGAFLVGPQISMKRYLKFVDGQLIESKKLPDSVPAGLQRGAAAIIYLVLFLLLNSYFPISFLLSEDHKNSSLIMKHVMLGLCGKLLFCKYIICWMLAEGSCTVMGLTYEKKDDGRESWHGCRNVRLIRFEMATQFQQVIESFNILTSRWAAHYVYKRLKFLGNRTLSLIATMVFLAVWHGFHVGYYCCFALEFVVMKMEKDIGDIVERTPSIRTFLDNPIVKPIKLIFLRIYVFIFLSYCMIPLAIPSWSKATEIFASVYYSGHLIHFGWLFCSPLLHLLLLTNPKSSSNTKAE